VQGPGELKNLQTYTTIYGKNIVMVIDGFLYDVLVVQFSQTFTDDNNFKYVKFEGECCLKEIERVKREAESIKADVVVGIGGGKTLDTAKSVANKIGVPVILVPTAASTDSPTSAMAIIYTEEGIHDDCLIFNTNPNLVLVDSEIIAKAPIRLFVTGIGDAYATYFEASDTANYVGKGYRRTKLGMEIAKFCYEMLTAKALDAKIAIENHCITETVEDVIEANILLSGLGFENTGCATAHGINSGLSSLRCAKPFFHGERVAFGTICQLVLENKPSLLIEEALNFNLKIGLPVMLMDMNIEPTDENIRIIAEKAVTDIESEPFELTVDLMCDAIKVASKLGERARKLFEKK